MATAVLPPTATTTPTTHQDEGGVLLIGISWQTYNTLREELDEAGSNLRLTYDQGNLEIMSPAWKHERPKSLLRRMVDVLTEELNIPVASGGSTTFRRELKQRGLEPDECYWVQHEAQIRNKDEIGLDQDPPPDLAIEVENTRRLLPRMSVYAGLGFPEVWRHDGRTLQAGLLQPDQTYAWGDRSACFPFVRLSELAHFLDQRSDTDETTWIRAFRAWVRDELAPRRAGGVDGGPVQAE